MNTLFKLSFIAAFALAITGCGNNNPSQTANNRPEQVIEESGQAESLEKETACEAAYQFVMNIVNENYAEVVELMTLEFFSN
jgi:hypothetical protein